MVPQRLRFGDLHSITHVPFGREVPQAFSPNTVSEDASTFVVQCHVQQLKYTTRVTYTQTRSVNRQPYILYTNSSCNICMCLITAKCDVNDNQFNGNQSEQHRNVISSVPDCGTIHNLHVINCYPETYILITKYTLQLCCNAFHRYYMKCS